MWVFLFVLKIVLCFKENLKLDMHDRGKTEMPSGTLQENRNREREMKVF